MIRDNKKLIEKKAYEIAYALFRISGNLSPNILGKYIENHCLSMFDSAIYGNQAAVSTESKIIEYYLRLGGDTGLINQENVAVLISELDKLKVTISMLPLVAGPEPINLRFSEPLHQSEPKLTVDIQKMVRPAHHEMVRPAHHEMEVPAEVINKAIEAIANDESAYPADRSGNDVEAQPAPSVAETRKPQLNNIEMRQSTRQSAIVDRIRQFGNPSSGGTGLPAGQAGCRMKELQDAFPAVSERTLRYDLEKLVERGLIERVGPGGPATFYRAKEAVKYSLQHSAISA